MALVVHHADPGQLLEDCFARIESERMQGVPILNPALRVQAAHVQRWQGQWLAALVTPWFLNLVLLPGDAQRWRSAGEGERIFHRFAAGDLAFLGNAEAGLGEFQACSLISPMGQFADQVSAVATACAAMAMLHVQPQPDDATKSPTGQASAQMVAPPQPPPARRVFLFGRS